MRTMITSKQAGVTLLELMITVMIAGILLGFGVPGLREYVQNGRMLAAGTELLTAVQITRSEAIKRRSSVTVCRSSNASDADPDCDTGPGDWSAGWVVFQDDDRDAVIDPGEEVIQQVGGFADTIGVASDNAVLLDYISFNSRGLPRTTANATLSGNIMLCDSRGVTLRSGTTSYSRALLLNASGRPQVIKLHAYVLGLGLACPV